MDKIPDPAYLREMPPELLASYLDVARTSREVMGMMFSSERRDTIRMRWLMVALTTVALSCITMLSEKPTGWQAWCNSASLALYVLTMFRHIRVWEVDLFKLRRTVAVSQKRVQCIEDEFKRRGMLPG